MAQNRRTVQADAPEYQDRSHAQTHTQAAHTNPNKKPGLMDQFKQMIPQRPDSDSGSDCSFYFNLEAGTRG